MSSQTKLKQIVKKTRVVILIIFLVLSLIAIQFHVVGNGGIAVRSITKDSAAMIAGMQNPSSTQPMAREVIVSMNNKHIKNVQDYYDFVSELRINQSISVKTTKKSFCLVLGCLSNTENNYRVKVLPKYKITDLGINETIETTKEIFNETLNQTVNVTTFVEQPKVLKEIIGIEDIGLSIYPAPTSNLRKGLDLQGGTRVLLKLSEKVDQDTMDLVLDNVQQRLNVYGLTDIIIREVKGFAGTGDQYVLVEIAGVNSEEIRDLISQQGKFEAKIGNNVVFVGGKDITYVARGEGAGLDYGSCAQASQGEYSCRFRFGISLTPEAAQRQADLTETLAVVNQDGQDYLNESLQLFLDDEFVDELRIAGDLAGNAVTEISISGGGTGTSEQAAANDAILSMKRLQTILKTGSLPVKINIVKTDTISPALGSQFIRNIMLIGILAIIGVSLVIFVRYKNLKVSIPVIITMLSEVFILLGFASLVGWNLDIAAIAGILIAVGTGVDDQIVITDETMRKDASEVHLKWKQRFKKALFIIIAAYATTMVAMLPLYFAGAGLVKGFALTTMAGVTIGVLITRPAFGAILEELVKK
jgi:preprotein translocase subunit SecD